MTLDDFIGAEVMIGDKSIIISYVGVENGYVMFAYKDNKTLKRINSNKVKVKIRYRNRPSLHGITKFIGRNLITALWEDDEGKLIKKGGYKEMDAPLSDIVINN